MMAEFFLRAWLGGLGLALVCAPLGAMMVWRRMAYFGDTLSHGALLGVALALFFHVHLMLGVAICSLVIGLLLKHLISQTNVPTDAVLGILSHTALAVGLIAVTALPGPRVDITALLMGDILSLAWFDVGVIWGGGLFAVLLFWRIFPTLLAATIDRDIAQVEKHPVAACDTLFILLLALVVALAIKVIGALLITALLIIPVASARQFSHTPEKMILWGTLSGVIGVSGGLWSSSYIDIATGPAIVCACAAIFFISVLFSNFSRLSFRNGNN